MADAPTPAGTPNGDARPLDDWYYLDLTLKKLVEIEGHLGTDALAQETKAQAQQILGHNADWATRLQSHDRELFADIKQGIDKLDGLLSNQDWYSTELGLARNDISEAERKRRFLDKSGIEHLAENLAKGGSTDVALAARATDIPAVAAIKRSLADHVKNKPLSEALVDRILADPNLDAAVRATIAALRGKNLKDVVDGLNDIELPSSSQDEFDELARLASGEDEDIAVNPDDYKKVRDLAEPYLSQGKLIPQSVVEGMRTISPEYAAQIKKQADSYAEAVREMRRLRKQVGRLRKENTGGAAIEDLKKLGPLLLLYVQGQRKMCDNLYPNEAFTALKKAIDQMRASIEDRDAYMTDLEKSVDRAAKAFEQDPHAKSFDKETLIDPAHGWRNAQDDDPRFIPVDRKLANRVYTLTERLYGIIESAQEFSKSFQGSTEDQTQVVGRLEEQVRAAQARADAAEHDRDEATAREAAERAEKEEAQKEAGKVPLLEMTVEGAQKEAEAARANLASVSTEYAAHKLDHNHDDTEYGRAQKDKDAALAEATKYKDEKNALEGRIGPLERDNAAKDGARAAAESAAKAERLAREGAQSEAKGAYAARDAAQAIADKVPALETRIAGYEAQVPALEQQARDANTARDALAQKLADRERNYTHPDTEYNALNAEKARLEAKLAARPAMPTGTPADELARIRADYESQLARERDEVRRLSKQLSIYDGVVTDIQTEQKAKEVEDVK